MLSGLFGGTECALVTCNQQNPKLLSTSEPKATKKGCGFVL